MEVVVFESKTVVVVVVVGDKAVEPEEEVMAFKIGRGGGPEVPELHEFPWAEIGSATIVWYPLDDWCGSILLDACYYRLKQGTVMELGITTILTSGLVEQLLAGSKIIVVDNNVREDRALLNGAQKLLGILIAVGEAVAYVLSGMYGSVSQLGVGNAIITILQLGFVGIIVICRASPERIWSAFGKHSVPLR
ncbi:hypothetical protein CASFOL_033674 [Castilleja foliolosa]|uniref:Solute carrier family 40 protein n=1 Tax=Castilleja foliolosa TaxID=1961234 RepID=A0ABD3BYI6_9LAMI